MPLPEAIRSFWYEAEFQAETCVRTPWGVVITDSRYPSIYDANHAGVLEGAPDLSLEEIRTTLHPLLRAAGASHEHVEFLDASLPCPAVDQLRGEQHRPTEDVVMVLEDDGAEPRTDAAVEEIVRPDEPFWRVYRDSRNEFGETLADDVVDQLVARDRDVFVPVGLRFFVGMLDGEVAGFTSLIVLAGVAYIDNVVTLPPYRRRGVASATVTRAVAAAHDDGVHTVFLLAENGGRPQRLYERLGFRVVTRALGFTRVLPPA